MCRAPDCPNPSTLSWERHATEAEGAELISNGDLPNGFDVSTIKLPVDACDDHRVNSDLATRTHAADCTAPPATPIEFGDPVGPRAVPAELSGGLCNCTPDPVAEAEPFEFE